MLHAASRLTDRTASNLLYWLQRYRGLPFRLELAAENDRLQLLSLSQAGCTLLQVCMAAASTLSCSAESQLQGCARAHSSQRVCTKWQGSVCLFVCTQTAYSKACEALTTSLLPLLQTSGVCFLAMPLLVTPKGRCGPNRWSPFLEAV